MCETNDHLLAGAWWINITEAALFEYCVPNKNTVCFQLSPLSARFPSRFSFVLTRDHFFSFTLIKVCNVISQNFEKILRMLLITV